MKTFLLVLVTGILPLAAQADKAREAMKKFEQAGVLAREGKYEPANQLMQTAFTEFDDAVKSSPDDYQSHLLRGMTYSMLPEFFHKADIARTDLEFVAAHPDFTKEPEARQTRVRERLAAVVPKPGPKDRFPQIGADVSPVIAVASYTVPGRTWTRETMDEGLKPVLSGLEAQPGLIASHVLTSVDRPGMLVILTCWKDKQALNAWFYGGVHQGIIQQVYGGPRPTAKDGGPSQVAMELCSTLPGGMRFSGGLFAKQ